MKVDLIKQASHSSQKIDLAGHTDQTNLLRLLKDLGYPIASSCSGLGVCGKCEFWDEKENRRLLCEESPSSLKSKVIKISYL